MLHQEEIENIAAARIKDAEALIAASRYGGAVYLCGYAVELGLKARICKTLNWPGYPSTGGEFNDYKSFKTHNLEVLLHLTGIEQQIREELIVEWSNVATWSPESRYNPVGDTELAKAESMLSSAKMLLEDLWKSE